MLTAEDHGRRDQRDPDDPHHDPDPGATTTAEPAASLWDGIEDARCLAAGAASARRLHLEGLLQIADHLGDGVVAVARVLGGRPVDDGCDDGGDLRPLRLYVGHGL